MGQLSPVNLLQDVGECESHHCLHVWGWMGTERRFISPGKALFKSHLNYLLIYEAFEIVLLNFMHQLGRARKCPDNWGSTISGCLWRHSWERLYESPGWVRPSPSARPQPIEGLRQDKLRKVRCTLPAGAQMSELLGRTVLASTWDWHCWFPDASVPHCFCFSERLWPAQKLTSWSVKAHQTPEATMWINPASISTLDFTVGTQSRGWWN